MSKINPVAKECPKKAYAQPLSMGVNKTATLRSNVNEILEQVFSMSGPLLRPGRGAAGHGGAAAAAGLHPALLPGAGRGGVAAVHRPAPAVLWPGQALSACSVREPQFPPLRPVRRGPGCGGVL